MKLEDKSHFTPATTKQPSMLKDARQDSVNIVLKNQRENDSYLLGLGKSTTNEFYSASQQMSNTQIAGEAIHQMLDSNLSSPTLKSELGAKDTAAFKTPLEQVPGFNRVPAHQHEVLAASGPGHSHHLKSQSTGNSNYLSNLNPQVQHIQEYVHTNSNSQGRVTETWDKKKGQAFADSMHNIHPLVNQGQAKSAVLATNSGKHYGGGAPKTEIKKIPSKKNVVSEKKARRIQNREVGSQQYSIPPTETAMFSIQNEGDGKKSSGNYRNTSQSNRNNGNAPEQMHGSTQGTVHNTPLIGQMFQAPPMPHGDQYSGFSFIAPIQQNPFSFASQGLPPGVTTQQQQQIIATSHLGFQMQPQPQVHFIWSHLQALRPQINIGSTLAECQTQSTAQICQPIAKQQKFYGVSPERAPLIFKQSSQEKRPYTSSGHILNKRMPKHNQQTSGIAALYLGTKTHVNGFGVGQPRNQSQPTVEDNYQRMSQLATQNQTQAAYSLQGIPSKVGYSSTKKQSQGHSNSNSAHVNRKEKSQMVGNGYPIYGGPVAQKLPEALHEEVIQLKQAANMHKEENIKLKTKIKILENEMGRKERTLEDFLQQNQFIQNAQKNPGSTLAPILQTAQRYQAETFLVMSLKKQVKEQKAELLKKEEELTISRKNIKNTKFFEMDSELRLYKDELIRLRYLLEQNFSQQPESQYLETSARPSSFGFTANSAIHQNPFITANQSQPTIIPATVSTGGTFKMGSSSQTNFFPDTASDLSKHPVQTAASACYKQPSNQYTLSNDDQQSNNTSETTPTNLPPLKGQPNAGQLTPLNATSTLFQIQNQDQLMQHSMQTHQALSISVVDTRENEMIQKLTSQLTEKEALVRKQQQQIEELAKQRPSLRNQVSDQKGGSAGPNVKTELQRIRKMLREKEKEVQKLKSDGATQASLKQLADEESDKKLKQLNTLHQKRTQEMRMEMKKLEEQNQQLVQELATAADVQKQHSERRKDEASRAKSQLKEQVESMKQNIEDLSGENHRLLLELEQQKKRIADLEQKATTVDTAPKVSVSPEAARHDEPVASAKEEVKLDPKVDGELGLISTVLGCRENRDRIEFAIDLKKFVEQSKGDDNDNKKGKAASNGLASDYLLKLTPGLEQFVKQSKVADLAQAMPKYDFISPSLALLLMGEVRRMLVESEIFEILNEKENETKLPFDALRDLCARFDKIFTDEHCAFITASYLTEINEAVIYINFKEFLSDLKDPRSRDLDVASQRYRATSSIGSEASDSELKRMRGGRENSPLSDVLNRSAGRTMGGTRKKSLDEEHMLDVAEAIFIKMADLLTEKGRSVRGIFTKYAQPEIFPDRSVLELLSPKGFLEGIKEVGIKDLQDFEVACLMRVLGKPELENAVILNEFIMIMENFGVLDHGEDEDVDDYVPDSTELSMQDASEAGEVRESELVRKEKKAPRTHDLKNIDAKGLKILRKLARFLLKQFLHPREFFGKAIAKQSVKTKKREYLVDTLKFKDFYLRMKIANIRKRLAENDSLNNELCLDRKHHQDLINVKLMVKALEEIAEEEQKVLMQEEKEALEKLKKERAELAANKESVEVETPRSDSADGDQVPPSGESSLEDNSSKPRRARETGGGKEKKKREEAKESYGIDNVIKFGNAQIRSKTFNNSPMLDNRFHQLNTIEEEKQETQTSNYFDNASEREDSKLFSSHHLRTSANLNGLEFDEDMKVKMSPDSLNKTLKRENKNNQSSQVVSPVEIEKDRLELAIENRGTNVGRLTGRPASWKDTSVSKSMNVTDSEPLAQTVPDLMLEKTQCITPGNQACAKAGQNKLREAPEASPETETKRQQ